MEGGMLLQFANRVEDLRKSLSSDEGAGIRDLSKSFCGMDDDQAFVTEGESSLTGVRQDH